MSKRSLIFLLSALLGVLLLFLVVPALLRALPTRYAMRLPEPLQALALPADPEVPLLPTPPPRAMPNPSWERTRKKSPRLPKRM